MKKILVLCFITVTSSLPQGHSYHYPTAKHSNGLFTGNTMTQSFAPMVTSGIGNGYYGEASKTPFTPVGNQIGLGIGNGYYGEASRASFTPAVNQLGLESGSEYYGEASRSSFTPQVGSQIIAGSSHQGVSNHHSYQHQTAKPTITKHFYIHAAPEETEEEIKSQVINIGQPRINYKVVFIKTPTHSSKAAKLALSQAQVEDKTIIYVLSQKSDISDIQTSIESAPVPTSKPEVFFIKYKTPEEALHAQKQIQAQYDSLGGTSEVSDEGIAPISSVIGSLESHHEKEASGSSVSTVGVNGINPTYLPSNK